MAIKILVLGSLLFVGVHLVPALGQTRARLVSRLTLNGYKGLFTLFSLLGLGLMIYGKSTAAHIDTWSPAPWSGSMAQALMLPAIILLTAAKFPTNIKRFTPHPMMWGFILWSVAHLLANGDLASAILFGSLGAYSVVAILSANQRGARVSTTPVPTGKEIPVIGIGIAVYVVLLFLHRVLFGVAVI